MIVVTSAFSDILDVWLASLGKARAQRAPALGAQTGIRSAMMTTDGWTSEVHAAVALAPGPARGLEIASHVQIKHLGPLGYLLVNTETLRELIDVYLLLEKWFYGVNWAQVSTDDTARGKEVSFFWDRQFGVPDRLLEQLHSMTTVMLLRSVCPTLAPPLRVDVMNEAVGESRAYRAAFRCPVRFGQDAVRLVYPVEALNAPIDITSRVFSPAWQCRQRTLRDTMPGATEFVRAVQDVIARHLPNGAPVQTVASRLNLSSRTLQRRLSEAGCSYRQLVDGLRERSARNLLEDPALSLREVAFLLGYAEQSAFNHAYLRWNQTAPHAHRHSSQPRV